MNPPEEQSQNEANELAKVPNPPVEELSQDELNAIAGGLEYLKLKGQVSDKSSLVIRPDINIKPGL
jgi:bacteriocin-like protein